MIVNPKGAELQVQLAKIGNKFYRVQEQFHQADQFSLPSMQSFPSAKSSNKHSTRFERKDFVKNQSIMSEYGDDVSLGSMLDK